MFNFSFNTFTEHLNGVNIFINHNGSKWTTDSIIHEPLPTLSLEMRTRLAGPPSVPDVRLISDLFFLPYNEKTQCPNYHTHELLHSCEATENYYFGRTMFYNSDRRITPYSWKEGVTQDNLLNTFVKSMRDDRETFINHCTDTKFIWSTQAHREMKFRISPTGTIHCDPDALCATHPNFVSHVDKTIDILSTAFLAGVFIVTTVALTAHVLEKTGLLDKLGKLGKRIISQENTIETSIPKKM